MPKYGSSLSLIIICLYQFAVSTNTNNCGYKSCNPTKKGYVNVHLIPHSHDDVGWVKTVDQFFYGTEPSIYRAGVIYIYDNVLNSLRKSQDRRFIHVETAFFWRWWEERSESDRNALKELVNNGQIEFTGGGWSMNDEAVTNYQSIIDQFTWGLKKLNDSFGDCGRPKMGWQIDPFGHSNEMASIFAQLGYDGIILGRIDFQDKKNRLKNKSMEIIWRGNTNLGRNSDIFTSVLYNHYDAPAGYCFDILCEDDPIVDNPYSPEYNVDTKAENFILNYVQPALESYQTNNIVIPMGRDFAYQEAESWFTNIDRLIKFINNQEIFNNTKYHLLYSTPSCYTAAVQKESAGVLTSALKTDDFLPYATDPNAFWTGFYTSRPTLKRYERMGNNFLQVCKQLYALTNVSREFENNLNKMRDAMGIMQHHDAITGTEKEFVAYDYARLLHLGFVNCENLTSHALASISNIGPNNFQTCLLTNVSQCTITESFNQFVVTIYNPLSRFVDKYVRLPVLGTAYNITGPNGENIANQIIPISNGVKNIIGRKSNATLELIFEAQDVPPLGYKSFFIEEKSGNDVTPEDMSLNFDYFNLQGVGFSIDASNGLANNIKINNISMKFDQRFWYYNGSNGWMSGDDSDSKASGAYIFRPDKYYPIAPVSDRAKFEAYRGNLVTEVHQTFADYVSQIIRIYDGKNYVEFDWLVGPLELGNSWPSDHGKEVISRFTTPLKSNSTFYTDSNGRQMVKRIRNYRPTWDFNTNETESSNYYPVTAKIALKDENDNLQFAVLTDRAEGGSSLNDGEVELMLLRNSITDDQLGVGEALIEIAFNRPLMVRGSHFVSLAHSVNTTEEEKTAAAIEQNLALEKLLDSWIFISVPNEKTFNDYKILHPMQFSGITSSLPNNVNIMTLEPLSSSNYLLRLEHIFDKNQDSELSQPAIVDLKDLFTTFHIENLQETTLGGNQLLQNNQQLHFVSTFQSDYMERKPKWSSSTNKYQITLEPSQIRTFIINVQLK